MNSKERDLLVELKTDIKYIRRIIKDVRLDVKEHNNKLDDYGKQMTIIESNQKNHLKHHEFLERETAKMYTKLGLFVSGLSILIGIILKVAFG